MGHVAKAVGPEMKKFLDPLMKSIKLALQAHGFASLILDFYPASNIDMIHSKKNAPMEEPIFQCLGMLATAVGPHLTKLLHDLLDPMFACGLSEALRQAAASIGRNIPPLLRPIQGDTSSWEC
jgi:serine/threonine-protein kinase mTOR